MIKIAKDFALNRINNFCLISVPVKTIRLAPNKNIIKNMEAMEGPLNMLKKCKDERVRLKVIY